MSCRPTTKLFCGCRNAFGEAPNTNICPVCLGLPGSLPVINRRAVELALQDRHGAQLQGAALDLPPQELLLSRHAQGLPDQPVRRADQRRRLPGAARRLAGRDRTGAHGRGHGQDDTCRRRRPDPRGRPFARGLQPRRRAARGDRLSPGHPLGGSSPRATSTSCARSSWPRGRPTAGWKRAPCAVDANVSVRLVGATEYGTRCEVKNLNSSAVARACHRLRGRTPDRAARIRRASGARDPALGRGATAARMRFAPRRRRTTTATSPSPI